MPCMYVNNADNVCNVCGEVTFASQCAVKPLWSNTLSTFWLQNCRSGQEVGPIHMLKPVQKIIATVEHLKKIFAFCSANDWQRANIFISAVVISAWVLTCVKEENVNCALCKQSVSLLYA